MKVFSTLLLPALLVGLAPLLAQAQPVTLSGQADSAYSAEVHRVIYPDPSTTPAEIAQALKIAKREHKRILLDFGANWCPDCRVLDYYFHQEPNSSLLHKNFVLVDVNVGRYDHNLDLAKKYEIPLDKGIPALAVLSENGRLLYSQKNGEFEDMRQLSPSVLESFLERWKPAR